MKGNVRHLVTLGFVAALASACNDSNLATAPVSNDDPVADIQGQPEYMPLDTAVFDGSASHDPDGGDLTGFNWEITLRPAGSASSIQYLDDQHVEVFVDLAGDYEITLTDTDDEGDTCTTTYVFSAVPSQNLHVELTWDTYTQTDIDLHLVNVSAGGTYNDYLYDCYYANCKIDGFSGELDWGAAGVTQDNPTLDIDNIGESVPENINIVTPANGTYEVMVYWFSNSGLVPASTWTIRIYLDGNIAYEQTRTMNNDGDLWHVAQVVWNNGSGEINEINTVEAGASQ